MRKQVIWFAFCLIILAGCSGNGIPTTPGGQSGSTSNSLDTLPVIGMTLSEDGSFNALGMMGAHRTEN